MITEFLRPPILCAVSGGVDSMYMLCRLKEEGYEVFAAHFNHGLRGAEADRDEAFVRDFCRQREIPFFAGRGDVKALAEKEGIGTEEAARELRYAFLARTAESCGAGCIATAHTADDNAETMLFRLARGTGLRGLGGIPLQRGNIVRPLLDETRQQAEDWLARRQIPHVEDSSNASDDFDRNRIRHGAVPVLKEVNRGFIQNAARTAALLRQDEDFLQSLAREHRDKHGFSARALAEAPGPVAARAAALLAGGTLSEIHVQALLRCAREGGQVHLPGLRAERVGDELVFDPQEEAELPLREIRPGDTLLPEAGLRIRCSRAEAGGVHSLFTCILLSYGHICGKLYIGGRRAGDRMRPVGRGCSKSMKQLFMQAGVPAQKRGSWPVLRDEKGPVALYGIAVEERVWPREGETDILKIEFIPLQEEDERS